MGELVASMLLASATLDAAQSPPPGSEQALLKYGRNIIERTPQMLHT